MHLRFVRLVVREGAEAAFQSFYRSRVIPTLEGLPGCLYAALLTPWRSDAHRSLTLWRSADDASAYESSGLYQLLLRESKPFLTSRTVWRARLAEEPPNPLVTLPPTSAAPPAVQEIPPERYELVGDEGSERLSRLSPSAFVRVVAVKLAPERRAEFESLYREIVLPALRESAGCLGAFLAEASRDPNEALSVTIWDREESATRYEMSGQFERLTRQVASTLSSLSQWRFALGEGGEERRRTAEVATYHLVQGHRLSRDEASEEQGK